MDPAIGEALAALLAADDRHVLLAVGGGADAPPDMQACADRVIPCGRGEHTAVLLAAGLAAEGRRPIVWLPAALTCGRAGTLLAALAVADPPDILLIVQGVLPAGVAPPALGDGAAAREPADTVADLSARAAATGPRVLHLP